MPTRLSVYLSISTVPRISFKRSLASKYSVSEIFPTTCSSRVFEVVNRFLDGFDGLELHVALVLLLEDVIESLLKLGVDRDRTDYPGTLPATCPFPLP